ncbi:MAG: NTP transferase domain-containing protein [Patescibacteria group bacterium]|jgi:bifunctional UDP-N-acetylglucosamine pyrophosphorylase/glucosamine-1-phosphate N-acetyltransferase
MKKSRIGVVILAAGKGKRMAHRLPKVLIPVGGTPMILRVLDAALAARFQTKPILVVGYKKDLVKKVVGNRARYAVQQRALGTGHAVAAAMPLLRKDKVDRVVVIYGDHPFVTAIMLKKLVTALQKKGTVLSCVTVRVPSFHDEGRACLHYGRILRDKSNRYVRACIEYKDATVKERKIREVNSGQYCFDAVWLEKSLPRLKKKNLSHEYYLTDLIGLAVADGYGVTPITPRNWRSGLGANTIEEIQLAERFTH